MKWNEETICNQIAKLNQFKETRVVGFSESPEICDLLYCKSDKWSAQTKKSEKTKKAEAQLTYTKNTSMNK